MLDLGQLLPHCKKDAKLDTKSERGVINEVADMKVCVVRMCRPHTWLGSSLVCCAVSGVVWCGGVIDEVADMKVRRECCARMCCACEL